MAMPSATIPVASGSSMSSFSAVWAYILPALDHVMRADPVSPEAPPLDVNYHMGVYTVVYNFATAAKHDGSPPGNGKIPNSRSRMLTQGLDLGMNSGIEEHDTFPPTLGSLASALTASTSQKDWYAERVERVRSMVGYELYTHLEEYFRASARDIRIRAPGEDSALLEYYLAAFTRFSIAAATISRLFSYLNRHFITRAVDEGMGWVSMQDVIKERRAHGKKSKKEVELLEAKKREQLKQWGFEGGTTEQRRVAEACAEAGSTADRIIPVASLALRCWRMEVVEPFLSAGIPKPDQSNGTALDVSTFPGRSPDLSSSPSSPGLHNIDVQLDGTSIIELSAPFVDQLPLTPLSKSAKKNKKKKDKARGKGKQKEDGDPLMDEEDHSAPSSPSMSSSVYLSQSTALPGLSTLAITPSPSQSSHPPPDPRGRLNRVVGELVLTIRGPDIANARINAQKLSRSLRACGVSADNLVRKRLDKYLKP